MTGRLTAAVYGGALTAASYGGTLTVILNAVVTETGIQYDDGTFIKYDDGSNVEAS